MQRLPDAGNSDVAEIELPDYCSYHDLMLLPSSNVRSYSSYLKGLEQSLSH
jgi:hypothetical protein